MLRIFPGNETVANIVGLDVCNEYILNQRGEILK